MVVCGAAVVVGLSSAAVCNHWIKIAQWENSAPDVFRSSLNGQRRSSPKGCRSLDIWRQSFAKDLVMQLKKSLDIDHQQKAQHQQHARHQQNARQFLIPTMAGQP